MENQTHDTQDMEKNTTQDMIQGRKSNTGNQKKKTDTRANKNRSHDTLCKVETEIQNEWTQEIKIKI